MKENAYKLLNDLEIPFQTVQHPPLFTCQDAQKYNINFLGCTEAKNLLLRNSNKSNYYLVILSLHKRADLKGLQESLKETKLSFADEETLFEKLKVKIGAASLLNVANIEKTDVRVLVDKDLLQSKTVGFHPSDNTETLVFASKEIQRILDYKKVIWQFV